MSGCTSNRFILWETLLWNFSLCCFKKKSCRSNKLFENSVKMGFQEAVKCVYG
uniref:Uncharacterized protein n=1 Tax=Helianthus annuus TaxID=4232 RepID=A0A251TFE3_HELAN